MKLHRPAPHVLRPTLFPRCIRRTSTLPRTVGTGELSPSTPVTLPPTPWYAKPTFRRSLVNILLLSSFINTTMIAMSYKSQFRQLSTAAKERKEVLKDAIEAVRRGKNVDLRAVLGTGDEEAEKKWEECMAPIVGGGLMVVLREIEGEDDLTGPREDEVVEGSRRRNVEEREGNRIEDERKDEKRRW